MTSFALFYNHLCLGDTIVMVSNFSATIKRWERKDDVVAIYDEKDNVVGINIFNTLNTLKIKALGLLHTVSKPVEEIVKDIVYGVATYKNSLDEIANKYIEGWTIDRIDKTGAAILRMGLYELKFTDTPEIVVINEAIELAKKYCDDSVRKIINAVLDKYIKE